MILINQNLILKNFERKNYEYENKDFLWVVVIAMLALVVWGGFTLGGKLGEDFSFVSESMPDKS